MNIDNINDRKLLILFEFKNKLKGLGVWERIEFYRLQKCYVNNHIYRESLIRELLNGELVYIKNQNDFIPAYPPNPFTPIYDITETGIKAIHSDLFHSEIKERRRNKRSVINKTCSSIISGVVCLFVGYFMPRFNNDTELINTTNNIRKDENNSIQSNDTNNIGFFKGIKSTDSVFNADSIINVRNKKFTN